MKRLSETLGIITSVAAVIVSIVAISSEFIRLSPDVVGVLVGLIGIIFGVITSYSVLLISNQRKTGKVFISYSLKDNDFVHKLSNDLSRDGFQVLRLDNVVMVGDNIQDKINESIQKADFFITVLSQDSLESDWVRKELDIATKNNKKIFPVLKENIPLPQQMASIQYADFTKEYGTAISLLAKSLRASERPKKVESS